MIWLNNQSPDDVEKLINTSNGRIFSVIFTKADGTARHMTARLGVVKGITGKGLSFDRAVKKLMVVWDLTKGEYRMIPLDRVVKLKINKETYLINP